MPTIRQTIPNGNLPPYSVPGTYALPPYTTGFGNSTTPFGQPNPVSSGVGFNPNPSPQSGQGAFGMVPGPVGIPDPFGDLSQRIPGLAGLNSSASSVIGSNLSGQLTPQQIANNQNESARYATQSGMPGSNTIPGTLAFNKNLLGNFLTTRDMQNQGLEQYNRFIPTVSGTQTVRPETQIGVAEQNAVNAAAPNPAQRASYAQQLYNQYLNSLSRGGSGAARSPAGGTGVYDTSSASIPGSGGGTPAIPSSPVNPNLPSWGQLSDNLGNQWSTGTPPPVQNWNQDWTQESPQSFDTGNDPFGQNSTDAFDQLWYGY